MLLCCNLPCRYAVPTHPTMCPGAFSSSLCSLNQAAECKDAHEGGESHPWGHPPAGGRLVYQHSSPAATPFHFRLSHPSRHQRMCSCKQTPGLVCFLGAAAVGCFLSHPAKVSFPSESKEIQPLQPLEQLLNGPCWDGSLCFPGEIAVLSAAQDPIQ